MVMKIEEGHFYKTRGGMKIGPMRRNSNGWVSEGGRINRATGYDWYEDGSYDYFVEVDLDLIAEWQDEPKKEISDMSEVKFKVGDYITRSGWGYEGYQVTKIDKEADQVWLSDNCAIPTSYPYMLSPTKWEIVKAATTVPEIGTKWVFNDGQDFVVRVVGFNDKGQIVLEVLENKNRFALLKIGSYFTFENELEKFGEFYKPWVEKVEKQKIVGCYPILRDRENGELEFGGIYQTEEQLKTDHKAFYDDSYEILDVVNVEWEQQ